MIFSDQRRTYMYSLARSMLEMCAAGGRAGGADTLAALALSPSRSLAPLSLSLFLIEGGLGPTWPRVRPRPSVRPPLPSLPLSLVRSPTHSPSRPRPSKSQYPRGLIMTRKVADDDGKCAGERQRGRWDSNYTKYYSSLRFQMSSGERSTMSI